jgi:D-alanyl-D-alanine carboxypeptidase
MRNTNGLIGRYPDADGMKTGFICASGFNVVATATRGGRKLIVVVFGSRSGAVRSEKAAQLFEKGFASGGLSWLMPSLGSIDALQPIAAAPPNLRDEMCGRHRKRPAAEDADEEEETVATSSDTDQSSAYAVTVQNLRGGRVARGPILGPYSITTPPVQVWAGLRPGADPAVVASARSKNNKKKKAVDTETAAAEPKPEAKKLKPVAASAGSFSLTPSARSPATGTFTPASAKEAPTAPPARKDAAAPAKPKAAAKKPADTKSADTKAATRTADKPADKPKP